VPDWLTDFFLGIGVTVFDTGTGNLAGEATRTWKMQGVDHKIRAVCVPCNTGWMSQLEKKVKPVLIPLLLAEGLPLTLSSSEQDLLAVWAYKTALIIDRHLKGLTEGAYLQIPASAYKRFYKSGALPDRAVRVWTVPISNPAQGIWWERTDLSLYHKPFRRGRKTIPRSSMNLYVVTFTIHHAVFQVCGPLAGAAVPRLHSSSSQLVQLFPRAADVAVWPMNNTVLMSDDLMSFARRTTVLAS
jgi:hypothetical protein